MYLEYFNLKEKQFEMTPDSRFLYLTPQHEDAIGHCQLTINERRGLVAVYGSVGMGKTTIARRVRETSLQDPRNEVAMLITPALNTKQALLRAIMAEFNVPTKRSYDLSMVAFRQFIIDKAQQGKSLVLIIDEAQELTPKMLKALHSLLNFESDTEKFIQLVLVGQNELATNIDRQPAIKSRVARFSQLQNLTYDDTAELIAFRWHTASAGKSSHPFSDKALEAIYMFSDGLPREIIKLCHETLLSAMVSETKEVTADMVVAAAKELRLSAKGDK